MICGMADCKVSTCIGQRRRPRMYVSISLRGIEDFGSKRGQLQNIQIILLVIKTIKLQK
jgi:hypothetical protein